MMPQRLPDLRSPALCRRRARRRKPSRCECVSPLQQLSSTRGLPGSDASRSSVRASAGASRVLRVLRAECLLCAGDAEVLGRDVETNERCLDAVAADSLDRLSS